MEIDNKAIKGLFWRADYYGAGIEGGMTSMQVGLLNALKKTGNDAFFVSSGKTSLPPWVNSYFIPHNKLLKNLPEVLNLPYNSRVIRRIDKIIEHEKPDYIYQFHHDFIYSGAKLKQITGLPFFLQCEGVQQWTKKHWGKLYLPKLLRYAEEIQWESADYIFTISEQVKKLMIEYGVNSEKIIVNASKVDPDLFTPEIDGKNIKDEYELNNNFVIAFTGTFAQWHGIEILAESIKYLKDKIPSVKVMFIGDGILRGKIEEIIKRDNVEKYSLTTGLIPFSRMPEYLAACDVLLTPCINNQDTDFFNSPIKLFEYMAMGKPIIATDVGQQGEVIRDRENGILIPEKDPAALADAVFELYKNPDLCDKIGRNARKDAVEKHNWTVNAKRIIDRYYSLV